MEKFWIISNDKYTWEGQIFVLSVVTCFYTWKVSQKYFLAFLGIFGVFWLFSEIFGNFLRRSYQIWLFWYKIRILQLILEHTGILNQSLDKVGINNAVLVLYSTTVEWDPDCSLVSSYATNSFPRRVTRITCESLGTL